MKRKLYLLVISAFISTVGFAQAPLMVGEKQLNVGFGFSDSGLPIALSLEFGVLENVSAGGKVVFWSHKDNNRAGVLGFANYHFNSLMDIPSDWDFYAGASAGFVFLHNTTFDLGIQIGGRYFVSDRLGLNLEFGGGVATVNGLFGITIVL